MSEPRRIIPKLVDFTSDGSIIVHGDQGEHLIIDLGPAHVVNLDRSIDLYIDAWKKKETPA